MSNEALAVPAMRAIKGFYFAFFFAVALPAAYFALYLKSSCGISHREIGILYMVGPAMGLAMQAVWGAVADATSRRSRVTALLVFFAAVTFPLLAAFRRFPEMLLILVVHHLFFSSSMPLADSVAFEQLGPEGRPRFGNLRVYGTVGFLVGLIALGPALDALGLPWLFVFNAIGLVCAAGFMWRIPPSERYRSTGGLRALALLYTNRDVVALLLSLLVGMMALMGPMVFLSVYASQLGATHAQISWIWALSVVPEVLVMLYAGRLVKRIGVKAMIACGMMGICLRWIPTAFATAWWQLLPLQMLHGVAFGGVYIGAVTFMDAVSPPRVRSSAQALCGIVGFHLSRVVGNPLCGEICERWGFSRMFLTMGIAGFVACVMLLVFVRDESGVEVRTDDLSGAAASAE